MTFTDFMNSMMVLSIFVVLGYIVREVIPFLNKIFLPASVIGGALALIAGPQVLGLIEIPEVFGSFSNDLLEIVIVSLIFGITLNRKMLANYLDVILVSEGLRMSQLFVGGGLGILLCLVFTQLPTGWGTMGLFSFCSGHPIAAAVGGIYMSYGVTGNMDIGIILSTVGLLAALIGGMIYVNYGIRKGWATFIKPDGSAKITTQRGILPEEQQGSVGTEKINGGALNNLLFQFAIIMIIIFLGRGLHDLLELYVWDVFANFPDFLFDMIVAVILWPILSKVKLARYYDRKTAQSISGFALDMIIVGAVATMNLSVVATYWLPLLIYCIVMIAVIFFGCYFFFRKLVAEEWFEKSVFTYGSYTGVTASGLALLRALDPKTESTAYAANSIASAVQMPFMGFTMTLVPMFAVTMTGMEVLISGAIMIVCLVLAWILFRKKVKALGR